MNWMLMGANLLERGEYARAEAFLTLVHDHLLQTLRLVEGESENWSSPTRRLEEDASATSYERYRMCTAALEVEQLAARHTLTLPESLLDKLDRRLGIG